MHTLAPLIKDLAIILIIASIVTLLFQKIRQPVVLGYLVAGIIVGPYTPPHALISDIPDIQTLSELGVIFLMFSLGLEFSFHKLKKVGFSAMLTGIVEVVCMLAIGLSVGRLVGWSFYESLFLGAALAISSTTIIIKALEELNLKTKRFAQIVFGVLIVEDILAILLLVGLSTVVKTHDLFSANIAWAMLKLILVIGGWFLIGYFLVPVLFRRIMHYATEETLTLVSIALCLFLVCVADYFHYSTALGAFIMGSILAETPLVHRIEELIKPVRNIFAAVFFVSIGMLIEPKILLEHFPLILLICSLTIIGKVITTSLGALSTGQSVNNALRIGFSMAQIGEFSFIIAGLGLSLKVTNTTLYPIIVAVSAITTFTTPYFIQLSGFLGNKAEQKLSAKAKYFLESYIRWIYRLGSSSAQKTLYSKALLRLLINGIIVGIIFSFTKTWGLAKIITLLDSIWLAKVLSWLLATLIASPFIWGMLKAFHLAEPDAGSGQLNYRFLLYFSWLVTCCELSVVSITYFNNWYISLILLIIMLSFFMTLYKQLDKYYQWFETRLVRNFEHKTLQAKRYEELAPWDTHLIEIDVDRLSPLVGKNLQQLQLRQLYSINVVAIYRGTITLLSPRHDQVIQAFDKLILLGSDEQIEKFTETFINITPVIDNTDLLEKFTIKTILLDAESPLLGKSIRDSLLREKVQGLVVGIERHGAHLLNPDSTTILEKEDLLFLAGDNENLKNI